MLRPEFASHGATPPEGFKDVDAQFIGTTEQPEPTPPQPPEFNELDAMTDATQFANQLPDL